MMTHVLRRRVLGGAIITAGAVVPVLTLISRPAEPRTLAAVLVPISAVCLAVAALVVAGSWVWPHVQQAVRGMHARRRRRRARQRIENRRPADRAHEYRMPRRLLLVTIGGVLAVAGVALALNYAHGRDVAHYNAETGWRAWLYPLTADGLLIVASLVLVWQLCRHGRTTWDARIAFALGILASAGTNILAALHADLDGLALIERITWTVWPTVGLLAAHEMLLRFLREYADGAALFSHHHPADVEDDSAQQAAESRAAAAEQRAAELATQMQHERQEQAGELDQLRAELNQARAELNELDEQEQDHDAADFEAIRTQVDVWIRDRLARGREVRTTDVPLVFRASLRWAQKHVPPLLAAARQDKHPALDLVQ